MGTTETHPTNSKPRKIRAGSVHAKVHSVRKSTESIAADLQTSCGLQISSRTVEGFMEWVSMAEQLHLIFTSSSEMQSNRCCGVKQATAAL